MKKRVRTAVQMEKLLAYQRERNRSEAGRACLRAYRARPEVRERRRIEGETHRRRKIESSHEHYVWARVRSKAKSRGLAFDLEVSDIVIPEFCPVLGIRLETSVGNGAGGGRANSPSVDRLDPSKGYTKGNVSVISHKANSCKSNLTLDELRRLVAWMERQCAGIR